MTTAANTVIQDGTATPVSVTFFPRERNGNTMVYRDERNAVFIDQTWMSITQTRPKDPNGMIETKVQVRIPTLEALAGGSGFAPAPKIAFYDEVVVTFRTSGRSTLQNRKHIRAYAKNLLAHALITEVVENNDPPR